ncbi:MAG: hypothetical protein GWO39_12850, partial [Gammaproteobacteria bacterium]|nr:hypothetical protein [Gammaproteobacteria bacterium]NIT64620.1 hypothetical protein [Gammaproteobacteria bacterium]NIV21597.1 hypothetical protein [Gammaproteobacteria bacterium]NIY33200.1 hypothetical protein [Gammaproteobacteria bacterium]
MAAQVSRQSVQIANVELGLERQKMLRAKLGEYFAALGKRTKTPKRLVYTVNAEDANLAQVLRMNPEADALFTGFAYDAEHSESFKQQLTVETPQDLLAVEPSLRYPRIAELLRLVDEGAFRHRKLVLVGDLYGKIGQYLRSALPVTLTAFADPDHSQVTAPIRITAIDRLNPDPDAAYVDGQPIPVG